MFLLIGSVGLPELIIIFGLILLLFGPKKLPEIGRSLGKGLREFKKGTSGLMESLNEGITKEVTSPEQPTPKAIGHSKPPTSATTPEGQGTVVDAAIVDLTQEEPAINPDDTSKQA
jgi:sec-independent protein translocase protein TatA